MEEGASLTATATKMSSSSQQHVMDMDRDVKKRIPLPINYVKDTVCCLFFLSCNMQHVT